MGSLQQEEQANKMNSNKDSNQNDYNQKPGWRKFLAYVGPGFLVSLAYLDPGNMETDLQAGANHRYELLWIILIGLIFALIIQSLAANLGVTTGKHLSELCRAEYPAYVKYCLWLLAEIAVIAADIPDVIGIAFALNMLFDITVWAGVLLTGLSTLLLLGLQRYGGFLELKMRTWARNLLTICIAITPSLIVSIIGGSSGAGRLIITASMILSFELQFALIPVLKFSSSAAKMGPHKNSIYVIVFAWIPGLGIIGIKYLTTSFIDWLIHNGLPTVGNVFIGILVFPFTAVYIISVIYLTFRKDSVITFIEPKRVDTITQTRMEDGRADFRRVFEVPNREDLADIPMPR